MKYGLFNLRSHSGLSLFFIQCDVNYPRDTHVSHFIFKSGFRHNRVPSIIIIMIDISTVLSWCCVVQMSLVPCRAVPDCGADCADW